MSSSASPSTGSTFSSGPSASTGRWSRCPARSHPWLRRRRQHPCRPSRRHSALLEALSAHIGEFGTGPGGLIFTTDDGRAIRRPHAGHIWRTAAKAVGLEGRSFHDLRHHCASVLIGSGASVKVVQRHLGHASATITLDTYSHLWPDDEDRTRAVLEAALRPIVNPAVSDPCHDTSSAEA